MVVALVAILIGAGAGLVLGGDTTRLSAFRVAAWWLIPLSACLYGLAILDNDGAGEAVLAALSLAALVGFAVANVRTPGLAVVAFGLALNLVPLILNGATVVTADVADDVLLRTDRDLGVARRLEVADDRLPVLGDAMSLPGLRWLVSFGDLIIFVGMIDLGYGLTRRRDEDDANPPLDIRDANNAAIEEQIPDPWIALVRGDIDESTYNEVTGEIRPEFASPTPTTGVMRLNDSDSAELPWLRSSGSAPMSAPPDAVQPAPTPPPRQTPTVPVMPSAEDDLDLSLVRWGDDTTPTSRSSEVTTDDTGEMDLRQLQELLDVPDEPEAPRESSVFAPPSDGSDDLTDAPAFIDEPVAVEAAPTTEPAPTKEPAPTDEAAPTDEQAPTDEAAPTTEPAPTDEAALTETARIDITDMLDTDPPSTDTGPIQLDFLAANDNSEPSLFDDILARFDESRSEPSP